MVQPGENKSNIQIVNYTLYHSSCLKKKKSRKQTQQTIFLKKYLIYDNYNNTLEKPPKIQ